MSQYPSNSVRLDCLRQSLLLLPDVPQVPLPPSLTGLVVGYISVLFPWGLCPYYTELSEGRKCAFYFYVPRTQHGAQKTVGTYSGEVNQGSVNHQKRNQGGLGNPHQGLANPLLPAVQGCSKEQGLL